ncbi:MAG: hypothetical protein AAGE59_30730 [Cyanobacteria bacterium P01_F01_bin.86]
MVSLVWPMVIYADDVTIGLQTRDYSPTALASNIPTISWLLLGNLLSLIALSWLGLIASLEWGH